LAIDAQENEPNNLRFFPPLMCRESQMQAVPVSAKNNASSDARLLSARCEKLWTYGLDGWSLLDVVLDLVCGRCRLGAMRVEKAGISLCFDAWKQSGRRRLDVPDKSQINGRSASDVFRVLVDLNLLHAAIRQEFREREVRAEQQNELCAVNRVVRSSVTEEACHADGV
jgi:hypothetical protein